jgi:hypothetical protein
VIDEIEVEEIALENAVPEQSTSIATIANDEAVAQHEGAVDDSDLEKAEDPSKGPSLGESATDSHGALLVITSPPRVTPESQPARPARSSVLAEIGAGVSYSVGQPLMRTAIVASTLGNLAYTGTFGVALLVLSKSLDPSAVTLGLLLGASGVGGVLGGLAAGPVGRSRHRAIAALLLWLLMPIALTLVPIYAGAAAALPFPLDLNLANFGDVTLAGVHLGVLNIGDQVAGLTIPGRLLAIAILLAATSGIIGFGETIFITILQQRIPPELMARVFSIQLMVAGAAQPLSLLAAGVLTAAFGAGVAFFAAAALFFIAAIIGFSSSALRRG